MAEQNQKRTPKPTLVCRLLLVLTRRAPGPELTVTPLYVHCCIANIQSQQKAL
jgi:hypothetical protein